MDQKVTWTSAAEISMGKILDYLRENINEDYAENYLYSVRRTLSEVADHPTKGMFVDPKRNIRRWRLDLHNYALYMITNEGILPVNILPYRMNIKGF
jgi:plasmid stabilization system protein ParE